MLAMNTALSMLAVCCALAACTSGAFPAVDASPAVADVRVDASPAVADARVDASPAVLDARVDASPDVADAPVDAAPDLVDAFVDEAAPCPPGRSRCGEVCVDLADTDAHCGACGHACASGEACEAGVCHLRCAPPESACAGVCVRVGDDPRHCAACGGLCSLAHATAGCAAGACTVAACDLAWADCDGDPADGCETDLSNSPGDCGACGARCARAHAAATCARGACVTGACDAGFGDCDGDPADGCETTLASDIRNCGSCGHACAVGEACAAGACVRVCPAGQTDCAGSCVALASDPAHCGACAHSCSPPHATAGCARGACTVAACDAGYGDCNGDPADGCEVDLRTSAAHCGACATACALAHATSACAAGRCTIARCAAGWGDCDRAPGNGCEADLASSAHCGSCAERCGSALVCRNARCECASARGAAGYTTRTVRVGGDTRSFRVYVPPSYDRAAATPMVFVYHGIRMSPDEMAADCQMNSVVAADVRPTLVVYPEGRYASWNASICCPLATTFSVDDLGFFDAMMGDLTANFCVDPRRVAVAGFSNGGMMAQRVACQRANVVASAVSVSGTYDGSCAPARPVPFLEFHATDDPIVPYDGGTFSGVGGAVLPSVTTTLRGWRAVDRCDGSTTTWFTRGDGTCFRYNNCAAEVSHCRLGSGGHRWPRPPQSLSASPMILDFMRAHPAP